MGSFWAKTTPVSGLHRRTPDLSGVRGDIFANTWGANGRALGRGLPPYPDLGFWDTCFRIWGYPHVTISGWF